MARLFTSGFETQIASATGALHGESNADGLLVTPNGTVGNETTVVRSGAASMSAAAGAANYNQIVSAVSVLDRAYFFRAYFRVTDATPTSFINLIELAQAGTQRGLVRLNTDGTLVLRDGSAQIGSASATTLSDNTWHRIEVKVIVPTASTGTLELKLDGTTVATTTAAAVGNSVTTFNFRFGCATVSGTGTVYVDDVALNDNQAGTGQTDYPGPGKVVLLKPASVNTRNTWVGPQTTGDDTTSLEQNVDNTPPLGISLAAGHDVDANAGKYVYNITAAAGVNFDINCQTYTAAGIAASNTIQVAEVLARSSVDSTTGTNTIAVAGVSNPAITADTGNNIELNAVAGAEPAGWKTFKTAVSHAPSVTQGTAPVIRVTKEVSSTRVTAVDLMALQVEYAPTQVSGDALDLVWDAAAQVSGNALDLVWDLEIEAGATPVDGPILDLVWDTPAAVDGGVLDLVADVRAEANGAALDLVWDVAGPAGAFSPDDIAGLSVWLDADAITSLSDGNAVTTWQDSSAANHDANSVTAAPSYQTNELNGKPVVRFDGVDDMMETSSAWSLNQPCTVFIVVKCNAAYNASARAIIDSNTVLGRMFHRRSSTDVALFASSAAAPIVATTPESWHVYTATFNGASSSIRIDGGSATTGNPGTGSGASDGMTIGAFGDATERGNIDVAEIVAYDSVLSSTDRANVETYLADKWIPTTVPESIPGLQLWLDADAIGGLSDNDAITTWVNPGALADATASGGPTWQTNEQNGLPIVRFDGTDDFFTLPDPSSLTAGTIFIVVKIAADPPASFDGGLYTIGTPDFHGLYPYASDGVVYESFGTTVRKTTGNPSGTLAAWRLYTVKSSAGNFTTYFEGAQFYTTATNTVSFTGSPTVLGKTRDGSFWLNGDVAEVVMYDTALSDADRGDVEDYLTDKWMGAAPTPVDGPVLDLIWDTRSQADSPVTELIWDTRAEVNGTVLDLIADLRSPVDGNVTDLRWDLAGAVASAVTELIWDLRTQVDGGVLDLIADLQGAVSGNVTDLIWDLRNPVDGNVTDLKWDLIAQVNSPVTELIWDTRIEIAGTVLDLLWDLAALGAVNGDPLDLVWDTRATVNGSALSLLADLRTQANGSILDLLWDTRNPVSGSVLDLVADLRTTADGNVTDLVWDLRTQVAGSVLDLVWDVEAFGAVDGTPLDLTWDTRVGVDGAVFDLPWDLRASRNAPATVLVWDVRTGVVSPVLDLLWELGGELARSLTLIWNLSAELTYIDYTGPLTLVIDPGITRSLAVDASANGLVVDAAERSLAVNGLASSLVVNDRPRGLVVDPSGPLYVDYEGALYLVIDPAVRSLTVNAAVRALEIGVGTVRTLTVDGSERALVVDARECELEVDEIMSELLVVSGISRALEVDS